MRLGLGPTTVPLQDGFGSWNASAADALAIWNGYLDFIHIVSVASPTGPQSPGDGVNSVFFSRNVFGDTFGEGTLAITVLQSGAPASVTSEADVIVNSAYRYNSYRGPLQPGSNYDLHRIFLHEFGHVLGLAHINATPPATNIMEPVISNWDHLDADAIAGVRGLYGAQISFLPNAVSLRLGDAYSSERYVPNNNPTSYSAIGLPPGITINSVTGHIGGTVTRSGVYRPVITAHGPIANAYGTFPITVHGLDEVPGLLKILRVIGVPAVADPIRPRVYLAGQDGISMIDTVTFKETKLVPGNQASAFRVSISADASTLLYTNVNGPAREYRIDLQSLSVLPFLPIPVNRSAILEGLDNRAYVVGASGVRQFDATTGALQHTFALNPHTDDSLAIAMSHDRRVLFVTRDAPDGWLSSFDISGPDPLLSYQVTGSFSHPTPSLDGRYIYTVASSFSGQSVFRASLPALSPSLSFSSDFFCSGIALGNDGSIYQSHSPSTFQEGFISVYNPVSLQLTSEIDPNSINPTMFTYQPGQGVVDRSGRYFFVSVSGYDREVWVFSTNQIAFPPPVHPTKNLLNISTRGRVETGENAMIGGFIIQGTKPKAVAIRGLGPSLPITNAMGNPVLDLYDSSGRRLASNDNWTSNRLNIVGTLLAPSSPRESALLVRLPPGAYSTVVRDLNSQPGLALVEIYDLEPKNSRLANISTRGKVGAGDNVLIGGFIIGGADPTKVIIRAIGPSLANHGIGYPLADPSLELHDGTGKLIARNDDWRSTQSSQIIATGIPPRDNRESALLMTLRPGNYTTIVRGKNGATGVALVEVYNLDSSTASAN